MLVNLHHWEKIQQARQMVLANRRVAIDEVACSLWISHGSAYQIIHEELRFHKLCARWVPRELTAEHKHKSVEICQCLLDRYYNQGEEFLSRIVTGDETWAHHYEPESKTQSMEWKHPGSPAKKEFKTQPTAGKVMLTVFGNQKGPYWKTTWKRGVQWTVQDKVICWPTIWREQFAPNAGAYCRRKCCCCMTMHAHTRPAIPSKPLTIWVSRCWNTLPTAHISPLLTTISLDHSKMLYEVVDFLRTKCGKRCINGCTTSLKPSWREYGSSWTAGPNVPKRKETMWKMTYLFQSTFV